MLSLPDHTCASSLPSSSPTVILCACHLSPPLECQLHHQGNDPFYLVTAHTCPVCMCACSVMSDSLRPHGLWPARLLVLGIFPGKNTAMDCHFLLQGIFPTQGLNLSLLRLLPWQADSFTTVPPRKLGLLP